VNAIELAGGPPGQPREEFAELRFDPDGGATLAIGSHNHGQGHETSLRQMLTTLLGLDPACIRIVYGDTDVVPHGMGTFGSRSMMACGTVLRRVSDKIIERGCELAAHLMEASRADIVFDNGTFRVAGTDRAVALQDVARSSFSLRAVPPGSELGLAAQAAIAPADATFPNSTHVCEVEVDPDTGTLDILGYVVVDDVGTVINPLLVAGQIHGGIAQGVGQALLEAIRYDGEGQMQTASFMDYGMPRAADFPAFNVIGNPVPTRTNPFGVKGVGEAGTVGALPAVLAAATDALAPLGITQIEMPLTPERVWRAIRAAGRAGE
jgi:carbon-monoxide dehydrogenase large subunit